MLSPGAVNACHAIPSRKDSCKNVPIILNFVYFRTKMQFLEGGVCYLGRMVIREKFIVEIRY